jgi:hypothetical protein
MREEMIVLEVEVCIAHLQSGYFLIYAEEEMDEGSNLKEVLDDLRYRLVKEGTKKSVEMMECYEMMGSPAKEGGCGYTYLTTRNGIR